VDGPESPPGKYVAVFLPGPNERVDNGFAVGDGPEQAAHGAQTPADRAEGRREGSFEQSNERASLLDVPTRAVRRLVAPAAADAVHSGERQLELPFTEAAHFATDGASGF
jgi:hypothetical protein